MKIYWFGFMVLNTTFNNISVISWLSVLLMEETGLPGKKTIGLSQVTDKLYHIMLYKVYLAWAGFELTLVSSWKSNCHTITTPIMTPTVPENVLKADIYFVPADNNCMYCAYSRNNYSKLSLVRTISRWYHYCLDHAWWSKVWCVHVIYPNTENSTHFSL